MRVTHKVSAGSKDGTVYLHSQNAHIWDPGHFSKIDRGKEIAPIFTKFLQIAKPRPVPPY